MCCLVVGLGRQIQAFAAPLLGLCSHALQKLSRNATAPALRMDNDVLHIDISRVVLASERDDRSGDGVVVADGGRAGRREQLGVEPVVGQGARTDIWLTKLHELLNFADMFGLKSIKIDEYARINLPELWDGGRNPCATPTCRNWASISMPSTSRRCRNRKSWRELDADFCAGGRRDRRPHYRAGQDRPGRDLRNAVEARNLAPLPADVDHTAAAALPISGLTAWQALFDHGRLTAGQTVLVHGAAGGVGSIAVQLAREAGARVIGTGRAGNRDTAVGLGVDAFVDLQADRLEGVGEVDLVLDVIGGEIQERSVPLVRAGGTLVTIASPPEVRPRDGRAVFFIVEPDRARLADLVQRLRDGRLKPVVGEVRALAEAPAAFAPGRHARGKTIIRVTDGG